jgi:4-alpha-glucanotransferase
MKQQQGYVKDALALLGIERLALAIHDQSFPSTADEEIGRGSPYSSGGTSFMRFAAELGFNCLQLGPQGKTSRDNPSPYDSGIFSKNEVSAALAPLAQDDSWCGLLDPAFIIKAVENNPFRHAARSLASYGYAHDTVQAALASMQHKLTTQAAHNAALKQQLSSWCKQNSHWLEHEGLFEALCEDHGSDDWRRWTQADQIIQQERSTRSQQRSAQLRARHKKRIEIFELGQFIVHTQHAQFHMLAAECGIRLFADLQIGIALRDLWAFAHLFLPDYLLGAPPSRTNPDGQPWGYPVLDPELYFATTPKPGSQASYGAALEFLSRRIDNVLADFDGLRIDHPHGIVCPWVYKSNDPSMSPLQAVQSGARLFDSPGLPDHPRLSPFAIAHDDQIDHTERRYADGWVKSLDQDQIERYSTIIDLIEQRMRARGLRETDLVCEVLSSCPFPLKMVLLHKHLGRFRVTQKSDPANPEDVYRTDTAAQLDWVMVGTHDTPPIWAVIPEWNQDQRLSWSNYLARRLEKNPSDRLQMAAALAADNGALATAMFADLFVGPAANVSIFFADLLGMTQSYNRPGILSEDNWVLSVPNNYKTFYRENLQRRHAVNLPRVLALALRARAAGSAGTLNNLADKLDQLT